MTGNGKDECTWQIDKGRCELETIGFQNMDLKQSAIIDTNTFPIRKR